MSRQDTGQHLQGCLTTQAADITEPITQVQVSIVKTKDVALSLPVGHETTGGTLAEADTDTKPRKSAVIRKHPGPAAREVFKMAEDDNQPTPDAGFTQDEDVCTTSAQAVSTRAENASCSSAYAAYSTQVDP